MSEVRPANSVRLSGLEKFTKRFAEKPLSVAIANVVEPGRIVPRPRTVIPKERMGELKVNVAVDGDVKKMPSPKTPTPKLLALQKSDPLQETTRSGKVTDVAVLEIGRSKSWAVCGPATAK